MMYDRLAINIIIDNRDAQEQVFVEIENDSGESIRIGENLIDSDSGYRKLRITAEDLILHEKL